MKAKGIFISTLLVIDTFFVSYAVGFQSRHVLIINPKLPPVMQKKVEAKPIPAAVPAKKVDAKGSHTTKDSHGSKTHGKDKPTQKPSGKPAAKPETKPDLQTTAKPAVKPTTKPAAKPATKPAAKPASVPSPKPSKNDSTGPGA